MYSYSYYEISDNNQTFFSEKHMNLWWPQTIYQAKACNRQTGNYMKEDIMRAGSRAWSRCMLNWDVYERQIGPLMWRGESQLSSSLWSSAVRPVPCGEGQKWGSMLLKPKHSSICLTLLSLYFPPLHPFPFVLAFVCSTQVAYIQNSFSWHLYR